MEITLSMTTCKRPELAKTTMESLKKHVIDLDRITKILHIDGGSSQFDYDVMNLSLRNLVPTARVVEIKNVEFPDNIQHAYLMQLWKKEIENDDYIFHCEDDWEFIDSGKIISDSIEIMESYPEIGQVGVWRKLPDVPTHDLRGISYWKWTYDPSGVHIHRPMGPEEIDIHWPGFCFPPSIIRGKSLKDTGNIERVSNFEIAYAHKWEKCGYKMAYLVNKYCRHIGGGGNSAYSLNLSAR
jgi:hypothetical protein